MMTAARKWIIDMSDLLEDVEALAVSHYFRESFSWEVYVRFVKWNLPGYV